MYQIECCDVEILFVFGCRVWVGGAMEFYKKQEAQEQKNAFKSSDVSRLRNWSGLSVGASFGIS